VENIDINGPRQVRVALRDGRRLAGRPIASSDSELVEMARTWGLCEGQNPREFSVSSPVLHAALNQAGVRLAAVVSVTPHIQVSIRCHRLVDVTLDDLCQPGYGTLLAALAHFLSCAVRARKNLIITGGSMPGRPRCCGR
jgi:type IV secretory pathway ATPase VirB11/archaellum biosynthesis ATPase